MCFCHFRTCWYCTCFFFFLAMQARLHMSSSFLSFSFSFSLNFCTVWTLKTKKNICTEKKREPNPLDPLITHKKYLCVQRWPPHPSPTLLRDSTAFFVKSKRLRFACHSRSTASVLPPAPREHLAAGGAAREVEEGGMRSQLDAAAVSSPPRAPAARRCLRPALPLALRYTLLLHVYKGFFDLLLIWIRVSDFFSFSS